MTHEAIRSIDGAKLDGYAVALGADFHGDETVELTLRIPGSASVHAVDDESLLRGLAIELLLAADQLAIRKTQAKRRAATIANLAAEIQEDSNG